VVLLPQDKNELNSLREMQKLLSARMEV
jgi:hypothetical protein